ALFCTPEGRPGISSAGAAIGDSLMLLSFGQFLKASEGSFSSPDTAETRRRLLRQLPCFRLSLLPEL
ncbi:hypothetical protein HMPREF1548_06367, partial [Clostridium sp. KLE 1755]